MIKGKVTIPAEDGFFEETKRIAELWGADAVRDCDGTVLPKNANDLAEKVYNTYFIVRGDNVWAKKHPEETHRTFLLSQRVLATGNIVKINVAEDYLPEQIQPDFTEIKRWEVCNRTTGEFTDDWSYDRESQIVTVYNAKEFCQYTVSFMAKVLWHPVQIYNYLTNKWTCDKQLMYDPAFPYTGEYVKEFCNDWCLKHKETNVVRFTTFLYQFSLVFNKFGKEKYVDWFGYTFACSPVLLDDFEKEYGYKLRAEDIIDCGCYNNPFRLPNQKFIAFMTFVQKRVSNTVKELVDIVHSHNKEAMMFLGDDWIGAEPYGDFFENIGLDAIVGSVGGGVTVRMLSEIPHVKYHEGRFLPYFFPDTFFDGNESNAINELNKNWLTARRAIMRKPLDRIGFGGYLSLAAKFPAFINRVAEICNEFRAILEVAGNAKPYCGLTVAILNSWGKIRSWQTHMVAHELWYQQIYSYQGILESLSGLAVNVKFINFEDVKKGIDKDIDIIINVGARDTAFSGGDNWKDESVCRIIRKWVYEGHGFIGVGEPTASENGGRLFRLSDVLGVDKELGFTLSEDKYNIEKKKHFITEDVIGEIDYGESEKNIYALNNSEILDITFSDRFTRNVNVGEVKLASNTYGKGRAVYFAGLPFSFQNARLLYRALFWAANKENDMFKAYSDNVNTECTYYPETNKYAIINNTNQIQESDFYDIKGNKKRITLLPNAILWI